MLRRATLRAVLPQLMVALADQTRWANTLGSKARLVGHGECRKLDQMDLIAGGLLC